MKKKVIGGLSALAIGALALAGCAGGAAAGSGEGGGGDDTVSVGFLGFAASNSFAQGTFKGVEEAAEKLGATAEFVDGNFDGQQQVQQINDAITTKKYDVIVIQANDNLAVQEPLQRAVEAGISVVVEFTPVGPDFETIEPQVEGAISVVDSPVRNGEVLADLALQACEELGDGCKVAYMEGNRSLPLDNARTQKVLDTLKAADGVEVTPSVQGGYTQDEGRAAFQDIVQAHPDVDVVIGSSQAIGGAALAAGADSDVRFIANGGSITAVEAVRSGDWFGAAVLDVVANGRKAAELGIAHFQGEDVEMTVDETTLAPHAAVGTKQALDEADYVSQYDD